MISGVKVQRFLAASLFVAINILFYFKYLYRVSFAVAIMSVVGYLVFLGALSCLYKKKKLVFPVWFWTFLLILLTVGSGIVLHLIPKESLNVDRWEMIQIFWDATSNGIYPYGVHGATGNYPGPMPFYFVLAYPFYRIGEIGWMTVVGIWITFFYFKKRLDSNNLGLSMLLVLSSLPLYWEIVARSTVFINSVLFALYFFSLRRLPDCTKWGFYGWALLGGVLFSTRNVFVLPLIIWGMYVYFKKRLGFIRLMKWGGCFILAFILTFVPFYCMDSHTFMRLNPFVIQGNVLLPFFWVACFVGVAFVIPFFCKRYSDVNFYSGILLFITITGHVICAFCDNGIDAYLRAGADISYYLFCFPFLLKSIVNEDNS